MPASVATGLEVGTTLSELALLVVESSKGGMVRVIVELYSTMAVGGKMEGKEGQLAALNYSV